MLQYVIKNEKNAKNLEKRYKDGRTLKESLSQQENKWFTAGSLFKANRVAIDSELLEYIEEKELETVRKQQASIIKYTDEYLTNKDRAELSFCQQKETQSHVQCEAQGCCEVEEEKG
jgi:UDP-N-acetylenolpyruvoylglucosamine reductase